MDTTSIPTSNPTLSLLAEEQPSTALHVGSRWQGRLEENQHKTVEITAIESPERIHLKDSNSGRSSTCTISSLLYRYTPLGDTAPVVTAADAMPVVEPAPPVLAAPAMIPPGASFELRIGGEVVHSGRTQEPTAGPKLDPSEPGHAHRDGKPDTTVEVDGAPIGAELVERGGERLYRYTTAPDAIGVRDLDLGTRVEMSRPRDIRRTIRAAIEDGAILAMPMENAAHMRAGFDREPIALLVKVSVEGGNGAASTHVEYHLSERAMVIVLTRLRTPKAVQIQVAIADAIALLRQGQHAEAARVVGAPEPPPSGDTDRAFSLVDRLENEGLFDGRTACLHKVDILRRTTGIDLSRPPAIEIELARPLDRIAAALDQLEPGESVRISRDIDETGTYSCEAIGGDAGFSGRAVAYVARAIGVHGDCGVGPDMGVFVHVTVNGRTKRDNWRFSEKARGTLLLVLSAVAKRQRAEPKKKFREVVQAIAAEWRALEATSPCLPTTDDGKAA